MVRSKHLLIVLFIGFTICSEAQVNRYIVFFADKSGTPYSISNPSAFLSDKAIQRRVKQSIQITDSDLPVNPTYVTNVRNTGATVHYKTRWMNGVLVSCDPALVPSITALSEVSFMEYVAPGPFSGGRLTSLRKNKSTHSEVSDNQLSLIGIDIMQSKGHRGEGITIAVFDGGFLGANVSTPFTHLFNENRFDANVSFNFLQGNANVFQHDEHGTRVFSIISAFQDGVFSGAAYKANFQLYVTEDVSTEYRIEEYNWLFAAERSDSSGVDIINSSVGYNYFDDANMNYTTSQMDGNTAVVTRAAQYAADKGILVVASAGNEGNDASWKIITGPADGKDVLAIGNVNVNGLRSSSSSMGPSADGRIKPDVMALGSGVYSVRGNGSVSTGSGTSFSSPLVASLAAGLWQRYPYLTNKELIGIIRVSASMALQPDNLMGYGIPHFSAVVNYIEQQHQEEIIAVFPNPIFEDELIIRPKNPELITTLSYQLLNTNGQVLEQRNVYFSWRNNQYSSDVSRLAAGVYFLKVYAGDKIYVYRLVKV